MTNAFVVPFRCRGTDPLRKANLEYVQAYVESLNLGPVYVVSDGRTGTESFCRHAAYNTGTDLAFSNGATTITYYEADMIVPKGQLIDAINKAEQLGLVIPFSERRELGPAESTHIRTGARQPHECTPLRIKRSPRRSGAVNIISRETHATVGQWDADGFAGSWWDDRAMLRAFDICAAPTRWIDGPSWTLYHLPGYEGSHLTTADKAATAANKARFELYRKAKTPEQIRELTSGTR